MYQDGKKTPRIRNIFDTTVIFFFQELNCMKVHSDCTRMSINLKSICNIFGYRELRES